jgi:hypothetical protein
MLEQLIERVNEMAQEMLDEMVADGDAQFKSATDLGLDGRASWDKLIVSADFIAIKKDADRNMQYYGGFEYVNKSFRKEIGEYVFYMAEDSRVSQHISHADFGQKAILNLGATELNDDELQEYWEDDWEELKACDGQEVTVLGEETDGYYNIKLPSGTIIDALTSQALKGIED